MFLVVILSVNEFIFAVEGKKTLKNVPFEIFLSDFNAIFSVFE